MKTKKMNKKVIMPQQSHPQDPTRVVLSDSQPSTKSIYSNPITSAGYTSQQPQASMQPNSQIQPNMQLPNPLSH